MSNSAHCTAPSSGPQPRSVSRRSRSWCFISTESNLTRGRGGRAGDGAPPATEHPKSNTPGLSHIESCRKHHRQQHQPSQRGQPRVPDRLRRLLRCAIRCVCRTTLCSTYIGGLSENSAPLVFRGRYTKWTCGQITFSATARRLIRLRRREGSVHHTFATRWDEAAEVDPRPLGHPREGRRLRPGG